MIKVAIMLFVHYLVLTLTYDNKMILTHIKDKTGITGEDVQKYVVKTIKKQGGK